MTNNNKTYVEICTNFELKKTYFKPLGELKEIVSITNSINQIQAKLCKLQNAYDKLETKYNELNNDFNEKLNDLSAKYDLKIEEITTKYNALLASYKANLTKTAMQFLELEENNK